jgi:hypothetical protein
MALRPARILAGQLAGLQPDCIHIAMEGPLGLAVRRYCLRNRLAFTTSCHTQFPEYVRKRLPVPLGISCALMRRFHAPAACTMVATPGQQRLLEHWRFRHLVRWSRGVDTGSLPRRTRPDWQADGRCSPMPAGSRWKRISRRFSGWNCPEASASSATDRHCRNSRCVIRTFSSPATSSVKTLPGISPLQMSSYSRA